MEMSKEFQLSLSGGELLHSDPQEGSHVGEETGATRPASLQEP